MRHGFDNPDRIFQDRVVVVFAVDEEERHDRIFVNDGKHFAERLDARRNAIAEVRTHYKHRRTEVSASRKQLCNADAVE